MATVWLTYAWADNESGDVDYVAQELEAAGVTVKLDHWNIRAGVRLWQQIEEFIQSRQQCDAWLLYATQASLGSEACKEEYTYALDRALKQRGDTFPVIGLFPATVDEGLVPAGIRTRLHVSLRDADWKERIVAAAEGRQPSVARPQVLPYHVRVHDRPGDTEGCVIEVRPRAGTWSPFIAGIPAPEKEEVQPFIYHGAAGRVPIYAGVLFGAGERTSPDGQWAFKFAQNEATPTMSYYIFCKRMPSRLLFGADSEPQYVVEHLER